MRAGKGSDISIILSCLALAVLSGLAIPLALGNQLGARTTPWTPPAPLATDPPLPPRAQTAATATSQPNTPVAAALPTADRLPLPTASPVPASSGPTPTVQATEPSRPTPVSAMTPTPGPTATARPVGAEPTATTGPMAGVPSAQVREGPLVVRAGPSTAYPILGLANVGDTFAVLDRDTTGQWLKVCCLRGAFGWVSTAFVDISPPLSLVSPGQ